MTHLVATYRLQLGPQLSLDGAEALVPYLRSLGVSHLYLSPVLQARAGSTHGYDVVDPRRISDDLGGEPALRRLAAAGLPLVVDIVPNHMAAVPENPFWADPATRAVVFDIDPVTGRHRRFFDIDGLAGVRVEDPAVFWQTHAKILQLVHDGVIAGLRVDHVDGLADPAAYLERLRAHGVEHVWIEKILEPGEPLRAWPVEGTTGYEFLVDADALLVDPTGEPVLSAMCEEGGSFAEVAREAKAEQVATTFTPEVDRLRATTVDAEVRDAIADALVAMPVYRSYVDPRRGIVSEEDRTAVAPLPDAMRAALLLERWTPAELVTRFQQTTGAVMAKGVEDTALYRHVRLLALNEVGGDPDRFGIDVGAFHHANRARAKRFPRTLLASTTHDTKRSGDARARLGALAGTASAWRDTVERWRRHNAALREGDAPDADEELFVYQTLVAVWPVAGDRLLPYAEKAMREAKRHTAWVDGDPEYERQVLTFVRRLLADGEFLTMLEAFVDRVAIPGERSSLAQLALRMTSPGVPDVYQGDEHWTFSLVDPDNRRPVDWSTLSALLAALQRGGVPTRATAKLFATWQLLALRSRHPAAFTGAYVPLDAPADVCAYRRGDEVIAVVPIRPDARPPDLAPDGWRNVLAPLDALYTAAPAVYEAP